MAEKDAMKGDLIGGRKGPGAASITGVSGAERGKGTKVGSGSRSSGVPLTWGDAEKRGLPVRHIADTSPQTSSPFSDACE